MTEIRKLDDAVFVAGQISPDDMAGIAHNGIRLIVNNRPDGEEPGSQPLAAELEAAAREQGLRFINIQFHSPAIAPNHAAALADVLKVENGPMLIFCRTGMRSATVWAAASLALGRPLDDMIEKAAQAGYNLQPAASLIQQLGQTARNAS